MRLRGREQPGLEGRARQTFNMESPPEFEKCITTDFGLALTSGRFTANISAFDRLISVCDGVGFVATNALVNLGRRVASRRAEAELANTDVQQTRVAASSRSEPRIRLPLNWQPAIYP